MHTLIIKGDETTAFKACDARKLEITSIVHRPQFDDTIVTVPASVPVHELADWYCHDGGAAPYPAGSLLWYGPARLPMPDNATRFGHVVPKPYDKAAERARMPDGSLSASRYIAECNKEDSQ